MQLSIMSFHQTVALALRQRASFSWRVASCIMHEQMWGTNSHHHRISQLVVYAGGFASRQSMGSAQQGRRGGRDQWHQCRQTKAICSRCLILLLVLLFLHLKTARINCVPVLKAASSSTGLCMSCPYCASEVSQSGLALHTPTICYILFNQVLLLLSLLLSCFCHCHHYRYNYYCYCRCYCWS